MFPSIRFRGTRLSTLISRLLQIQLSNCDFRGVLQVIARCDFEPCVSEFRELEANVVFFCGGKSLEDYLVLQLAGEVGEGCESLFGGWGWWGGLTGSVAHRCCGCEKG